MNTVDTTTWAARSLFGALLLFLLAAPVQLLAQQKQVTPTQKLSDTAAPNVQRLPGFDGPNKTAAGKIVLDQAPNQTNGIFSDEDCDFCAGGVQTLAENFTLAMTETLSEIVIWGGYFPANGSPPDDFTVIFHADAAGLPGAALSTETGVSSSRTSTGIVLFGVNEYKATLDIADVVLGPGTYWVEIFNNTVGDPDSYFWEVGDLDPVNGLSGQAFSFTAPGSAWNFDSVTDLAIQLIAASTADLAVEKEMDFDEATKTGSYHITVTNNGPTDATGVHALDTLPSAITITGWTTTQGTFDPFTGAWDIGALADGASAGLWIDVTFDAQGRYTNSVEVWGDQEDDDPSNNEDEVSIVVLGDRVVPDFAPDNGGGLVERGNRFAADLGLGKTVDNAAPAVGDNVTYTITITNGGPQSTAKVVVTDNLPECLTFVNATASRGSYDAGTGFWSVGAVKVGDVLTLEITATVGAGCAGTVTNTAWVSGSSLPDPDNFFSLFGDPTTEDDKDSADFTVASSRELDGRVFALGSNYPNPFNPSTVIPYSVAEASHVSITVYDLLGRAVSVLVNGTMPAGVHEALFEASQLPTGMYLVRMEAAGVSKTMRITLMK